MLRRSSQTVNIRQLISAFKVDISVAKKAIGCMDMVKHTAEHDLDTMERIAAAAKEGHHTFSSFNLKRKVIDMERDLHREFVADQRAIHLAVYAFTNAQKKAQGVRVSDEFESAFRLLETHAGRLWQLNNSASDKMRFLDEYDSKERSKIMKFIDDHASHPLMNLWSFRPSGFGQGQQPWIDVLRALNQEILSMVTSMKAIIEQCEKILKKELRVLQEAA